MPTMVMKLEHQEQWESSFLARQMSMWFYDTSSGTAERAARYGS
jgi:hypothetical protein